MKFDSVNRRLIPLFISSFFGGLVFWYAIEKVFMQSIGFDTFTITLSVVLLSLTGLLLEVPSGILADRWSRKRVMAAGYLSLAIGSLLLGLATNVTAYMISSIFFGIYFALHSGTVDSIIYDVLIEERESRNGFEKYLGRNNFISVIGLVIGSLLGSVIAERYDLQLAYFLTVPSGLLAMTASLVVIEPTLHKKQPETELLLHTKHTFKLIFQRGYIAWIVTAIVATSVLYSFMLEVDQLWPLALDMPIALYGPLNALLLIGYGVGGIIAYRLIRLKFILRLSYIMGLLSILALSAKNMPVIAVSQFLVLILFVSYSTILIGKLHDELPSGLRSGASSLVNTLINIIFIPAVLIFGFVTQKFTIFHAPFVMLPIAIIGIICTLVTIQHKGSPKSVHPPNSHPPSIVTGSL